MDKKENPVLLTTIQSYLHQHGYKLTPQREEIIRVLLHTRDHLSVEDIYSILKRQNLNIGLATVYRTMDILYDIKVVDKVSFGDHIVRYEWRKESLNRAHHHLFCTECGKIIELDDDFLSVYNDGISIDMDHMDQMFKAYEVGEEGQFGLGLAIVNRVMTNYKYDISVENINDGVKFTIRKDSEENRSKRKKNSSSN